MPDKRLTIKKRILLLFMVFVIVLNAFPMSVFAHNAYFIKVTYDKGAKKVVGQVVYDDVGSGRIRKIFKHPSTLLNSEKSHQEYRVIEDSETKSGSVGNLDNLKLTFPGKELKNDKDGVINNGGSMDATRAVEIANTLVAELNDYIYAEHPEGFSTYEEFKQAVEEAKQAGSSREGGTYIAAKNTKASGRQFLTSMVKGYGTEKLESGAKSPIYDTEYGTSGGDDVINWSDLIDIADAHEAIGIYYADAGLDKKPGVIEAKLSEFLGSVLLGLQSMLGLYSTNDLVFNQGSRAVGFYGGIMSIDWMNKVVGFHIIFLSIAFSVLVLAIAKLLFQRNLATISTYARISLIDGIKDLITVVILLGLLYPIITVLIRLNNNIVEIMAATAPSYSVLGTSGAGGDFNNFAGIIVMFFYFFISIYLNVVFIIRAVTLAFLIATAPLFVMAIAFGNSGKSMFIGWARELVANIFLQAFFAFIISFFTNIQTSTRVLENLVIAFSLIPLSGVFRGLILGQGGGATTQIAHRASAQGAKTAGAIAVAGGALALAGGGAMAGKFAGAKAGAGAGAGGASISPTNALGMAPPGVGGARGPISPNNGGPGGAPSGGSSGPSVPGAPSVGSGSTSSQITSTPDNIYNKNNGPENENYKKYMEEESRSSANANTQTVNSQSPNGVGETSFADTARGPATAFGAGVTGFAVAKGMTSGAATSASGTSAGSGAAKTAANKFSAPNVNVSAENLKGGQEAGNVNGSGVSDDTLRFAQPINTRVESENFENLKRAETQADNQENSENENYQDYFDAYAASTRQRTPEEEKRAKEKLSDSEKQKYEANTNPNWRDVRRQAVMGSAVFVGAKKVLDKGINKVKPVITNTEVYQKASVQANKVFEGARSYTNAGKGYVSIKKNDFTASHPNVTNAVKEAQVMDRKVYSKAVGAVNHVGDKAVKPVRSIAKQAPRAIGRTVAGVTAASAALAYGGEDPRFAYGAMSAANEKLTPRRLQHFQESQKISSQNNNYNNNNPNKSKKYYEASRNVGENDFKKNNYRNNNVQNNNIQAARLAEEQRLREERDQEDFEATREK